VSFWKSDKTNVKHLNGLLEIEIKVCEHVEFRNDMDKINQPLEMENKEVDKSYLF
jgi:hypothetical protein